MNLTNIKSRKVISVLLSVLMILSLFPFATLLSSASDFSDWKTDVDGKWKFEVIGEGTPDEEVILKDYLGDETELTIPTTVKAKDTGVFNVTDVGHDSSFGLSKVTKITIPASIKKIGKYAFSNMEALTTVEFLKNADGSTALTDIGEYAFRGDSKLSKISIPNGITKIMNNTFESCSSLSNVDLPDTVSNIGDYAFADCTALSELKLPVYLMEIGKFAFKGSALKKVDLPTELGVLNEGVFMNCTSLETVFIYSKVKVIDKDAFNGCSSLKNLRPLVNEDGTYAVDIPDYVAVSDKEVKGKVTIPSDASIIGGESLVAVNKGAFKGCSSLGSTLVLPENVITLGGSAFEDCASLKKLFVLTKNTAQKKNVFLSVGEGFVGALLKGGEITNVPMANYGLKAFSGVGKGFTIYGFEDTDPKFYAVKNGIPFVALDLKSISVNRKSVQDAYTVGQPFDPSGITIDAEYYPNSPEAAAGKKNITQTINTRDFKNPDFDGFEVSDADTSKTGIQRITVSYEGKSTQTKIKVTEPFITGIKISKYPKTKYFVNDKFTTDGLELTAKYSDGSTKKVTTGFTTTVPNTSKVGRKTVTVTYMGKTTTYEIRVDVKKLSGIKVDSSASKTVYKPGEKFDTSKIKVYACYNNGVEELITGFTTGSPDMKMEGKQAVRVSYGGKNTAFNIYVVKEVAMHRMYNPNSGEHFYTANVAEKDNLIKAGWNYEGIGWYAPNVSGTPVYRVYNPNAGDHHYTTSLKEKNHLVKLGWRDEGIGWYSSDTYGVAIHRQYNPNAVAGSHNFTKNVHEKNHLVSLGWKDEGIGWYGVR